MLKEITALALLAAYGSTAVTDTVDSLTQWLMGKSDGTIDLTTCQNDIVNIKQTSTEPTFRVNMQLDETPAGINIARVTMTVRDGPDSAWGLGSIFQLFFQTMPTETTNKNRLLGIYTPPDRGPMIWTGWWGVWIVPGFGAQN